MNSCLLHIFFPLRCGSFGNVDLKESGYKIHSFIYTNPKSQRNSGLFCKFCTSRTCSHLNVSINIMPSYLSVASNTSFNHQCLELEETTNFVEVGCLKKTNCMVIYL